MKKLLQALTIAMAITTSATAYQIPQNAGYFGALWGTGNVVTNDQGATVDLVDATWISTWSANSEVAATEGVFEDITVGSQISAVDFDLEEITTGGSPKLQFWNSDFAIIITSGAVTFSHDFGSFQLVRVNFDCLVQLADGSVIVSEGEMLILKNSSGIIVDMGIIEVVE